MTEMIVTVRSYQSRSVPFSQQQLVNCYPESGVGKQTKTPVVIYGTPGLKLFTSVGEGPIRGMEYMNNVLYVVSGDVLYRVDSAGAATNIGSVEGSDVVGMANNGTELCVVSARRGFIYNHVTGVFGEITDPDFRGADSVTYIGGYFIFNDGDLLFNSALKDGLSYDSLDVATAEYDPDIALRIFADHNELWVFGANSVEPWFASGGTSFPYAPRQGTALETGMIAKNSVAKQDNSIFWFGIDNRGGRVVWRANGYTPIRISTHALEKKWDEYPTPEDAIAFSYSQEGHAFYVLTLPGTGTYVYDAATEEWHERRTFGRNDWRIGCFVKAYNRRLVGDRLSGNIYELDLDTYTDNGDPIERVVTSSPIASPDNTRVRINFFRADFEGGTGLITGQGSDPQIMMSYASDGSPQFGDEKFRSLGKVGKYSTRVYWRGQGMGRQRVYKLRMTDPVKFALMGMYLDVEKGSS